MMTRPKTGLSIAINQTMASYYNGESLVEKQKTPEFSIKIANTLEEREAAFRLGYKIYLEKGYISPNPNEWLIRNFDLNNDTVILIVRDKNKNIAATATLVFDGSSKLPAEKVYGEEIKGLKNSGLKTAELCRLAVSYDYRYSKEVLVLLFNYAAIYIHHVKKYDGLAIEVTPRHKNYYKALLNFDEIGSAKPCPQVQNTVGVLLYLPATRYQETISRCGGKAMELKKERSLYPYFLKAEQENLVAHYLQKQVKPMSADEKIYFGLSESGISRAVCV